MSKRSIIPQNLPVVALIGRPNVGKSTLFNQLTKTRDALVANFPGLTRDRKYGYSKHTEFPFITIDTGGLVDNMDPLEALSREQALIAIAEADLICFVVDARAGLMAADMELADFLRKQSKQTILVANKVDGLDERTAIVDFYQLGLGDVYAISAAHSRGINDLIEVFQDNLSDAINNKSTDDFEKDAEYDVAISVIGRPNVGKSTLLNSILGEERFVTCDYPGTTRDTVSTLVSYHHKQLLLIDTAGLRRKSRVHETVEKFSVVKAMQAIGQSNVVIFLMDAWTGVVDQDARLLGHILASGKAMVIAVNKWDGLSDAEKKSIKQEIERKLSFIRTIPFRYISALHGSGVGHMLDDVIKVYNASTKNYSSNQLTSILMEAVNHNHPPVSKGFSPKLRYAHLGGLNPPRIIIHGNRVNYLGVNYQRYLSNFFADKLKLVGTPIRLEFKASDNPYKHKKNQLTSRQVNKKRRLKKYIKNKSRR